MKATNASTMPTVDVVAYETLGERFQLLARRLDALLLDDGTPPDLRQLRLLTTDALHSLQAVIEADEARRISGLRLDRALRRVADDFDRCTSSYLDIRIQGDVGRIPGPLAGVLLQVAREALWSVNRFSRSTMGVLTLTIEARQVTLDLVDDGVDLPQRQGPGWRSAVDLGLRRMRRAAEGVGGRFVVCPVEPRGLRLRTTVPLECGRRP